MKKLSLFFLIPVLIFSIPFQVYSQDAAALQNQLKNLDPQTLQSLPPDVQSKIQQVQQDRISNAVKETEQQKALEKVDAEEPPEADSEKDIEKEGLEGAPVQEISKIEAQYRQKYASEFTQNLKQFGYDLFLSAAERPSTLMVPDDTYIIGPGDKLNIRFWGSGFDGEFIEEVSADGNIDIPRIGILQVAGIPLGDISPVIRQQAEKYFQGINIHVSLEELRSVEIYVVGAVVSPGLQLVPAFSSVMGGLLSAGGIHKTGSLRNIELYRNQKLLFKIDLYELLLKGSRKFDIVLENKDMIFVPRLAKTAAVAGAVYDEAIFELSKEKTIQELVELSGGILPQGFTNRVYLRRFEANREFVVEDINTLAASVDWKKIAIQDGDLLEFQFIPEDRPKVVRLDGHVKMPDVFQYRSGLKLSDVLTSSDLLQPESIMEFGHLHRYDPASTRAFIKQFPLKEVFSGEFDMELQPYDTIVVLSREEMAILEEFSVQGAVWKPGRLPYRPYMTLADAIALAGGGKFGANTQRIELSRQMADGEKVSTEHRILDLSSDGGFVIEPYDYIFLPRVKDAENLKTVTISGEVKFPGEYRLKDGERISDLIQRAGGFTEYAYFYGAKYTSESARRIQQQSIDQMVQNLRVDAYRTLNVEAQTAVSGEDIEAAETAQDMVQNMLSKLQAVKAEGRVSIRLSELEDFRGSKNDFEVEDGDTLHIPKYPNFVAVVGSVFSPSAFLFEQDQPLIHYLAKSGGPTKSADDDQIYVIKANGEVFSKSQSNNFDKMKLMPGDTIVVPEDLERVPYLRLVRDITDIVFKVAVTVGVLVALF